MSLKYEPASEPLHIYVSSVRTGGGQFLMSEVPLQVSNLITTPTEVTD